MTSILHIHDQAGVSCILAKYQRKLGHTVTVLKSKRDDQMGFLDHYKEFITNKTGTDFDDLCVDLARDYDIIHVHSISEIAVTIKHLYPKKKVFIHYHGSDLRFNRKQEDNEYCNQIADRIFYATPDLKQLLPDRALYIPTIIDTDLFYNNGKIGDKEFTLVRSDYTLTQFKLPPNVIPIKRTCDMKYGDVPDFLRQYGVYHDTKYIHGIHIRALSKTALECLALGLKVVDWEGKIYTTLDEKHKPENVIRLLDEYYK